MLNCIYQVPIVFLYCRGDVSPFPFVLFNSPEFSLECSFVGYAIDFTPFAPLKYCRGLICDLHTSVLRSPNNAGDLLVGGFTLRDYSNQIIYRLSSYEINSLFGSGNFASFPLDIQTFLNKVSSIDVTFGSSFDDFVNYIKEKRYAVSKTIDILSDSLSGRWWEYSYVPYYRQQCELLDYDLYKKPLDNDNVFQTLNGIVQNWQTTLSDDDKEKIHCIESYNRNFILFHQNELSVTENQSSSDSSSNVDLSTINTQLTNIANNLKTTVHDDNTGEDVEVSVTDIIKDKEDTNLIEIQEVETKNKELVPFLNNDEWSF